MCHTDKSAIYPIAQATPVCTTVTACVQVDEECTGYTNVIKSHYRILSLTCMGVPSPQIFIFHTCLNRVSCGLVLSRFHLLGEFDDGKRSCRKRLADHNRRRRKPQPNASQPSAESIGMKSGDDDRANGMWPTLASSGYHQFLHHTPCSKILSFRLWFLLYSPILVLFYNSTRLVSSTYNFSGLTVLYFRS